MPDDMDDVIDDDTGTELEYTEEDLQPLDKPEDELNFHGPMRRDMSDRSDLMIVLAVETENGPKAVYVDKQGRLWRDDGLYLGLYR
jgi:hypothetical protein